MKEVTGKVAFITGGASGIGLGMAKAFTDAGMRVVIADVEQAALDRAQTELSRANANVLLLQVDVTDRAALEDAAQRTEAAYGNVHVVCNNAGVENPLPLDEATYGDWDWVMGVNFGGVINGVQTFVHRLKAHGEGGQIVNTASMAGLIGPGGSGIYRTSKFAVVALTEDLRVELAPHGIGASVLCPGQVDTEILHGWRNRPEQFGQQHLPEAAYLERYRKAVTKGMDALEVGKKTLEGIQQNDLYIITHPEWKPLVERRNRNLEAAFGSPDPAKIKETMAVLKWILKG